MYTLDSLEQICHGCRKCKLGETRNQLVFGKGKEDADMMLIGEGPGYNEDQQGIPFVGVAGQLLDKILTAIELSKEEVYIANIVKCRPPNNRNPLKEEEDSCLPYLRWQVKIVEPQIIVCLGAVASKRLIDENFRITREHGKWFKKGNYWMIATYHPAALLRDESKKRDAWDDWKIIKAKYDELKGEII